MIYISYFDEISIAIMEDNKLQEYITDTSIVGHIYVGKIKTVLPGRFSFIDIGTKKDAFMNLKKDHDFISGQIIPVQVEKDALGDKAPQVTNEIKIKGRFIVLFKNSTKMVGVSDKITNIKTRKQLKAKTSNILPNGFSAVIRTNAASCDFCDIEREMYELIDILKNIEYKSQFALPRTLIYPEKFHKLREMLKDISSNKIIIDTDIKTFDNIKQEIINQMGDIEIERHTNTGTLFNETGVYSQLKKAMQKSMNLPSGGNVTFEKTEACYVIDVNTASLIDKDMIKTTNFEAADLIATQIRIRNYTGIIIIDFIDMKGKKDKEELTKFLKHKLINDRIKTQVIGLTELGLMQVVRKRTRNPLQEESI